MQRSYLIGLYRSFFGILCLKKKPQDIASNKKTLVRVLIIYFIVSFFSAYINLSQSVALPFALLDLFILLVFLYICLFICGFINRWHQSVMALAGTGTILGVMAIPLLYAFDEFKDSTGISALISVLLTLLLIWYLIVNAHIFRHAFSILFIGGLVISVLYYLLTNALVLVLLPGAL